MDSYAGSQSDPISLHKYLYASADPTNVLDPSGNYSLTELSTTMGIGAIISGTISAVVHRDLHGADFWTQVGMDAGIGGLTARISGAVLGVVGKALSPLLKTAITPLFRAIGRIPNLTLVGESGVNKLLINMSRFFFRTTKTYPRVGDTSLGRALQFLFPDVDWEMHHVIIHQAWTRVGGDGIDLVSYEGEIVSHDDRSIAEDAPSGFPAFDMASWVPTGECAPAARPTELLDVCEDFAVSVGSHTAIDPIANEEREVCDLGGQDNHGILRALRALRNGHFWINSPRLR
jgi:hypothetical protein